MTFLGVANRVLVVGNLFSAGYQLGIGHREWAVIDLFVAAFCWIVVLAEEKKP